VRRFNTPGFWAILAVLILLVAFTQVALASQPHPTGKKLSFSTFTNLVENDGVKSARILDQDSYVVGTFRRRGGPLTDFNVPFLKSEGTRGRLVDVLSANQVPFEIDQQLGKTILPLLSVLLPGLILIVVLAYFIASFRFGTGIFGARSGAKRVGRDAMLPSFDDVAGQSQAVTELRELAQFLVDPGRFRKLGARIPKGVLLYGPPGCGKTLLARAVAGESGAAFYSISGSDFVESYVGVGAARVRELFSDARENAPSIVFIDEIDAVARKRRSGPAATEGTGEEQGQALNQLLTEMDGFSSDEGTIVIAATNRPDELDPTRRCCARAASTARSPSTGPTRPAAPRSSRSTPAASRSPRTSTCRRSRVAPSGSPAPTWRRSRTRQQCSPSEPTWPRSPRPSLRPL